MILKLEKNLQNCREHSVPDVKLKGCQNFKTILGLTFLFHVKDLESKMKGLVCATGSLQSSPSILGISWIPLGSAAVGDDR